MKKLLITLAGVIFLMTTVSCSKSSDKKAQDNDLDAEDYAEMVAYISEAMDEFETINSNYGPNEAEEALGLMREVVTEYPEVKTYMNACLEAYNNDNPEFKEGVDESEMAQLMDYQSRGWLKFW